MLVPLLFPVLVAAQQGVTEIDLDLANCFGHHAADVPPFKTTMHVLPDTLVEVPASGPFTYVVTITNAWKHEMQNVRVGLDISKMPNVAFEGEELPFQAGVPGTVAFQEESEPVPFPVGVNATSLTVTLEGAPGALGVNDLDLIVAPPSGRTLFAASDQSTDALTGGAPWNEELVLDAEAIRNETAVSGAADWNARVAFPQGSGPDAEFTLTIDVAYDLTRNPERFVFGPNLKVGESAEFRFELRAGGVSSGEIGVRAVGMAFYNHNDPQAVDNGNYSKTAKASLRIGSQFSRTQVQLGAGVVVLDPLQRVLRQYGFLLGFTGFFLIGPSLLLGGAFGTQTVRWMNQFSGSARQRVLWHNGLSYILLAIGVTHATIFLLETTYHWTVGVIWGGLTLSSFIGLGITGALQTRIVKTYGYSAWRFTHFMMGFLALFFAILHVVVDGVDFVWLRDALG